MLYRVERSSDQVIKPVNLEALSKWVGNIPDDVVRDMADIAPMLSVLGYDPYANPPDYGKADSWVKDNTLKVEWLIFFLIIIIFPLLNILNECCFDLYQVKAEEKLWKNRANQILQRNDMNDEVSNLEDDSPDNDLNQRNSNNDHDQT